MSYELETQKVHEPFTLKQRKILGRTLKKIFVKLDLPKGIFLKDD